MTTKLEATRVSITVNEARTRDAELTKAVNELLPAALKLQQGILVTRKSSARYTCEVHSSVPWGTIQEKSDI